jgi:PAS domain S-box-containing protein
MPVNERPAGNGGQLPSSAECGATLARRELASQILKVLNRRVERLAVIGEILTLVKDRLDFEALGIRLRDGDDYPYYEARGFPAEFVEAERYLCARDASGRVIRDGDGRPLLECMCGNVLQGRTDPSLPFFSDGGSFWSNNTTRLLASTTEAERQGRTRNRCNGEGYESVALVPLRSQDEIIGLLQLNDRRPDRFTPDLIRFLEELAVSVAVAVGRNWDREALSASEAQYRQLIGNLHAGVVVHAPDTSIILNNPRASELLGLTDDQLRGRTAIDPAWRFVRDDGSTMPLEEYPVQQVLSCGQPVQNLTVGVNRPDGSLAWVLANAFPVARRGGGLESVVVTFVDVTDRVKAETRIRDLNRELELRVLQRTAELSAANRELESFAYSVSHDLRSPLRGIDGFSRALLEDYAAALDDRGRHYLERLCAAARRMGTLIDDLLELSRYTRQEMRRTRVDLSAVAGEILAELHTGEPARKAETIVQPGLAAEGDPSLIRAVLQNLLENAWKFTGGREEARIEFGQTARDGQGCYFVRDNGVGFEMCYAGKLFGAFQRLHSREQFPGTGIGLATVQRIVRRHGGRAWAEAEAGKGATFYFTLG